MEIQGKNAGSSNREGAVAVGIVTEALPNTLFRVNLSDDTQILAYLSGKMRLNRIRVLIGDRVEMVLDPYGGKGRITRRL
jgi:translation initiation factor IF-1